MPNVVGPEAMEDWLFSHGIRRPAELAEAMRVIDQYVAFRVRQRWPQLSAEPPAFVPASPDATRAKAPRGDPDIQIRCSSCAQVKRAGGNYHRRPDTVTGWGLKCTECMRLAREAG